MRAISLFSGAGGDTLGLEQAGFTVVAFSENNLDAIQSHKANFPHSTLIEYKNQYDITQLPDSVFEKYAGTIDLIFAGFPCQSFSHAGKKQANDPRGALYRHFVRAVNLIRPKWIMGENVTGLLTRDSGSILESIVQSFLDIGYNLQAKVINCSDFGVPQSRKRLILTNFEWAQKQEPQITLRSIIEPTLEGAISLRNDNTESAYWFPIKKRRSTGKPHPNLVRLLNGIRGLTPAERAQCLDIKKVCQEEPLLSFGKRTSGYHGEIVDLDQPCKTVICSYASCPRLFVGLENKGQKWVRTFTISELAQIQGFPRDYIFHGSKQSIIKQIGNAVPPPVIRQIAYNLIQRK